MNASALALRGAVAIYCPFSLITFGRLVEYILVASSPRQHLCVAPHFRCLGARVGASGLGVDVGAGAGTPRLEVGHAVDDGEGGEAGPEEEAEGDGGLGALAEVVAVALGHADEDGEGDGAGEPEEGRQGQGGEGDNGEEDARDDDGDDGDVEEDEDGPDGVEELEVELRGRPAPPDAVCLADDCAGEMSVRVLFLPEVRLGGCWTYCIRSSRAR
jgi:hypothetical protein